MRDGITIEISADGRVHLEAVVADRDSPKSMSGGLRSSWPRPRGLP
jgi:hypothetical protein